MPSKRELSYELKENNSEKIKFRKISNDPKENKFALSLDIITKHKKVFNGMKIEVERLSQVITKKNKINNDLYKELKIQKDYIKKLVEQIQVQKNEIQLLKQDIAILKNKDTIIPNVFFHGSKKN